MGLALTLVLFCAAPVPGDVGGCGQPVQELDAPLFFRSKKVIDCDHCRRCGFQTKACDVACDDAAPTATQFPPDCLPLVHDGEVCLRVLVDADCDDYEPIVRDRDAEVPTECNFCPLERVR